MGQSTFDDDDLFGEAADEMREAVESYLRDARADLPAPEAVWESDADNVLGALNGLNAALDTGDAIEELRAAKKQYVMGERAGAFDEDDELAEEIEELEELIESLDEAHERVSELTTTVPGIRNDLEEAREAVDADEADAEADGGSDEAGETDDADEADAETEAEAGAEA